MEGERKVIQKRVEEIEVNRVLVDRDLGAKYVRTKHFLGGQANHCLALEDTRGFIWLIPRYEANLEDVNLEEIKPGTLLRLTILTFVAEVVGEVEFLD